MTGVDIRVTVVGDKVYPCRIEKTGSSVLVADWRTAQGTSDLVYTLDADFPSDLGLACVRMLVKLGLKFGAFDFIRDANGVYWFLEVNPNGQWAFVVDTAGLQINAGFATLFDSF